MLFTWLSLMNQPPILLFPQLPLPSKKKKKTQKKSLQLNV